MNKLELEALKNARKLIIHLGLCDNLIINFECEPSGISHDITQYSLTVVYQHPEEKDNFKQKFNIRSYDVIDFYEKLKIFWPPLTKEEDENDK